MAVSNSTDRFNGYVASLAIKIPCVVASTTNITLNGTQTVEGVALVTGDRVLVTGQTDPIENGIYLVTSSAWKRAPDFDGRRDAVENSLVLTGKSAGSPVIYKVDTATPFIIGEDAISFSVFLDPDLISGLPAGTDGHVLIYDGVTDMQWESVAPPWITDAPSDGNEYVRKDGAWAIDSDPASTVKINTDANVTAPAKTTSTTGVGNLSYYDSDDSEELAALGFNNLIGDERAVFEFTFPELTKDGVATATGGWRFHGVQSADYPAKPPATWWIKTFGTSELAFEYQSGDTTGTYLSTRRSYKDYNGNEYLRETVGTSGIAYYSPNNKDIAIGAFNTTSSPHMSGWYGGTANKTTILHHGITATSSDRFKTTSVGVAVWGGVNSTTNPVNQIHFPAYGYGYWWASGNSESWIGHNASQTFTIQGGYSGANIDISPLGTGNVILGNFTFDGDATVGAGQDNYVLTYDDASGTIGLEPGGSGGPTSDHPHTGDVTGTTALTVQPVAITGKTELLYTTIEPDDEVLVSDTSGAVLGRADVSVLTDAGYF